jgi:hypothetical protein
MFNLFNMVAYKAGDGNFKGDLTTPRVKDLIKLKVLNGIGLEAKYLIAL